MKSHHEYAVVLRNVASRFNKDQAAAEGPEDFVDRNLTPSAPRLFLDAKREQPQLQVTLATLQLILQVDRGMQDLVSAFNDVEAYLDNSTRKYKQVLIDTSSQEPLSQLNFYFSAKSEVLEFFVKATIKSESICETSFTLTKAF
jgi:hypothetical protein